MISFLVYVENELALDMFNLLRGKDWTYTFGLVFCYGTFGEPFSLYAKARRLRIAKRSKSLNVLDLIAAEASIE